MKARNRVLALACAAAFALVVTTGASAGTMPRAQLVKKADAVCKAGNAKTAALPDIPMWVLNPAKATTKQVKASASYFAQSSAISKDEITRMFAVGTPSEPKVAAAWKRLHVVLFTQLLPASEDLAAAAKRGDGKAIAAIFKKIISLDEEETKLVATIGFKVCGRDS